jgi:hypothetical protein
VGMGVDKSGHRDKSFGVNFKSVLFEPAAAKKFLLGADELDRPLLCRNADIILQTQGIAFPAAHDPVGTGIDQLADIFNNTVDGDHYSFPETNFPVFMEPFYEKSWLISTARTDGKLNFTLFKSIKIDLDC